MADTKEVDAKEPEETKETKETEETKGHVDLNKIRPQLIVSFIVNLTLLSCGLCYSWAEFYLPHDNGAWEVVAVPIGAILGSAVSGSLLDHIGRKWPLYVTNVPFLACWVLILVLRGWEVMFAARFAAGVSVGAVYTTAPIYLGELVETKIRGLAIGMMPLLFNLGYVVMSGASPQLNRQWMVLISLVPSVLSLLSAPWIPESPYYDLKKKKDRCAALTLTWLRRSRDTGDETKEMQDYVEADEKGGYRELFTIPAHRKALLIVLLLFASQQLSGMLAIQLYKDFLFADIHLPVNNIFVLSALSLLTGVLSVCIVDTAGRRPLFLASSYTNTLSLLVAGAFALVDYYNIAMVRHMSWIPMIAIALHTVSFGLGLAPIPHIVSSEFFTINEKSWANMIANIFSFLLAVIVAKICQPVIEASGFHFLLLAFGAIQLVLAIFATVFMPETKRKSFAVIQKDLAAS